MKDIFEFGPGLVLGRAKSGRVIEGEARVIAYAREHGYPAPEIHEVRAGGTEIVMQRLEGPMMMDAMLRRPWQMGRYARLLADLHDRLHVIPAPDWLKPVDDGDRLVHGDLHPMNVMLTASGPVVIDWTNARRGDPALDVALTWVIGATSETSGGALVRLFLRRFVAHFDRARLLQGAVLPIKPKEPTEQWAGKSPDITHSGLAGMWSEAEMVKFLTTGKNPDGEGPTPPMPVFHLRPEDARAVTLYLRALPGKKGPARK